MSVITTIFNPTTKSGILALYWIMLILAVAAMVGSTGIALTTPINLLRFDRLPAWRPAWSFGLIALAAATLAIGLRAERRYHEYKYTARQ